ncbi:2-iminoacetate synthase ThiH [Arabiibacter massiliensis]|uniref:2-iminoacetate synthase ThiH n=1 Tax=Arabiibacter massiliensis TaxID=1870985 RepID=UPI0009BB5BC3|nr:2-iminoacetate synthase ThiH [Arabiibacter massiliensis]
MTEKAPAWDIPRFTRLTEVDAADIARDRGLDPFAYLPDMDGAGSPVLDEVLERAAAFDFDAVREADVRRALAADMPAFEDFGALLAPAAEPLLEELALAARAVRTRWFGTTAHLFTPLYLANFCDNHCVYCGFNRDNDICRARLDRAGMIRELDAIAATGLEDVLLLTGEDRARTDVGYIAEAVELAAARFRTVGLEVYPMNVDEYARLHACGADYVTVFQETYNPALYGRLHLAGRKRVFPYRAEAQERALAAGMRGVAFGALLGLGDFRRDALACGLHAHLLQRAYPHAELSLSCPRLRPAPGMEGLRSRGVGERQLLQAMCAYRLFLPQAGITISSRERAGFRDHAMTIAATKISAGVSTGVGEHAGGAEAGDDQFEIADGRDVAHVSAALRAMGLEPVMNDHVLV